MLLQPLHISTVPVDNEADMLADPPTSEVERFRHWITDVEISPVDADPNCKFSSRVFVDHELVCNLPWIDYTRSLRWSGLLLCDVSPLSKVSLRLCRSFEDKPRYFNFPPFIISEIDEETGKFTFELPEAAWVVTIKSLTPTTVEQRFLGELEQYNAIGDALQFAIFAAETLPECTAKVSFLIYMKAWELLDQQPQLDDTVQAILHGLNHARDIIDVASQTSSSMLATSMNQSKELITGILALLGDISVYIFNRHTTNHLAHILDEADPDDTYDVEAYLDRLDGLQKAFYASWAPTDASSPATTYLMDSEPLTPGYSVKATADDSIKADLYQILNVLRPINPSGYDLDQACLDGTREAVLNKVFSWMQNRESSESFMWISGQAGMGKTAIATTLCRRLDSIRALAGSFFCRRDDPSSSDPLTLINNLACEMAMNCPTYAHEVSNAIRANPKLCNAHLSLRYQGLVKRPLKQLKYISMPTTLVVIVDGLDECGDEDARATALEKLYEMSRLVPWLKVIVTGRPVSDLQKPFQANCPHGTVVHLQDYDATPDIRAYIQGQLGRLAETERWPSHGVSRHCTMSQGVFLWAMLATRYIKKSAFAALPRLQKLLTNQKSPVTDHFDALYTRIPETAINNHEDEVKDAYLRCIGSILATSERETWTAPDLQYLLLVADQVDQFTLEQILENLAPLLLITDVHIGFLHASFKDFVSDSSRSGGFHIQLDQCAVDPAASCLKIMQRELRFNICQLETSHLLNSEVPDLKLRIQLHIGPTLRYACVHWIDHFVSSPTQAKVEVITEFFEGLQLMYWIEVLSLLGRLDVAIAGLSNLASLELAQFSGWSLIKPWVKDARRLILSFYDAITASTPHLYISALAFAPSKSPTTHRMRPYFPNTVTVAKDPGLAWHPCVKTTTHPRVVQSLSISPNGSTIVVGYDDGSLATWDLQTGTRISESLMGHGDSVTCVVYSPNGNLIASSSYDTTIRVWDAAGRLKSNHVLAGHACAVYSVAFSPDSTVIASGSSDNTIRLWDCKVMCALHGPYVGHSSCHSNSVNSIVFSANGGLVVSTSSDGCIHLRNATTLEQMVHPFGHSNSVDGVAFTPDGTYIVSGSADMTTRVWKITTLLKPMTTDPFVGHSSPVHCVAISSDGTRILSGSADHTVRTRDAQTGAPIGNPYTGHSSFVYGLAFILDGTRFVSGSIDMTLKLWDTTKQALIKTYQHKSKIRCVVSSPDSTLIAIGSDDEQVYLWDPKGWKMVNGPLEGHPDLILLSRPLGSHICLGKIISSHTQPIRSIALSPCGTRLISGSDDNTVRLWDIRTGNTALELIGHSSNVAAVAFSPDGSCIASASFSNTIRLWNSKTGKHVGQPLAGHSKRLRCLTFTPDGGYLVSGSDDNIIRAWSIDAYFRQANDKRDAFCWPTNPHELSPHSHHAGWVTQNQESLVFWLPPYYQQPENFPGTYLGVPCPRTFLDYSKLGHGTAWTAVVSDSVNRSSG